jgi:alkanesulfonate monooxygenase SsuD/methylene tetrahydromethanopterin reductase-like flavin-dependent oxidoreductase (luciferase family)
MTKPRVGVVFRPQSPPEELRATALAAEAAGIDELWLWEDCFSEGGLTSAAAALAWTSRITVGIGLMPVPLRNPALAAMEIATLARMFPGRFQPALGHGVLDWMAQVGARAASPMTLLREYTAAVRALLHGETVTVDGRCVHLDAVALDWPPARVPALVVGARGPKTLALAGEIGDGVLLDAPDAGPLAPSAVRALVETVASAAAAAGRPAPRVVSFVAVDPARDDLAEAMAETVAQYGGAGVTSVVFQAPGTAPDPAPLIDALAS